MSMETHERKVANRAAGNRQPMNHIDWTAAELCSCQRHLILPNWSKSSRGCSGFVHGRTLRQAEAHHDSNLEEEAEPPSCCPLSACGLPWQVRLEGVVDSRGPGVDVRFLAP